MKQIIKAFLKDLIFEINEESRKWLRHNLLKTRDSIFSILTTLAYRL